MPQPTTSKVSTCGRAHCKCMNLGGNCPNHHYRESCFGQPTNNGTSGDTTDEGSAGVLSPI